VQVLDMVICTMHCPFWEEILNYPLLNGLALVFEMSGFIPLVVKEANLIIFCPFRVFIPEIFKSSPLNSTPISLQVLLN